MMVKRRRANISGPMKAGLFQQMTFVLLLGCYNFGKLIQPRLIGVDNVLDSFINPSLKKGQRVYIWLN